ncbi:YtxH domain-containing protein [Pontibacter vulgaris]|uniref:YtxH domain-containing protein n=1 Tax=Pontibacter vulgaris TaxID=2905679 RepID=UPI001FA747F0|nr:YtxH domain-containing protein [Pontibacter vulgaris]
MKDNSGKVILALLAGASAGVIAGLLMAPDNGETTRKGISKWAGKLSKDLEKNLNAGLEELKNMSGNLGKMTGGGETGASNTGSSASGRTTGGTTGSGSGSTSGNGNATGGNA